jgi:hypothetical protein
MNLRGNVSQTPDGVEDLGDLVFDRLRREGDRWGFSTAALTEIPERAYRAPGADERKAALRHVVRCAIILQKRGLKDAAGDLTGACAAWLAEASQARTSKRPSLFETR